MQSKVIGEILNYYTGERLPVVMARVLRTKIIENETELDIMFETSSHGVGGTFRYNESVRHALIYGAEVPVAIRFVGSGGRQLGVPMTMIPTVVMVGLTPDALENPHGIMVYSTNARTL